MIFDVTANYDPVIQKLTLSASTLNILTTSDITKTGFHSLIQTVEIQGQISSISEYCFISCSNLLTFTVAADCSLTQIQQYAFHKLAKLKTVNLGSSIQQLGKYCFSYTGISEIAIPPSLSELNDYCFSYCFSLTQVIFESPFSSPVKTIPISCFYNSNLSTINLPSNLVTISGSAFRGVKLVSITIPKTTTSIASSTFIECTNLINIFLEDGNSKFFSEDGIIYQRDTSSLSFFPCGRKGNVIISNNCYKIADSAFQGANGITSVVGKNIKELGSYSFRACSKLESVDFPNLQIFKNNCFEGTKLTNFSFTASVTSIGESIFVRNCSPTPIKIIIDNSLQNLEWKDDILYWTEAVNDWKMVHVNPSIVNADIPMNVKTVSDAIFCNCQNLATVNINHQVSIQRYAFESTGIKSFIFPRLNKLGDGILRYTTKLKTVSFVEGFTIANGKAMPVYLFRDSYLEEIDFSNSRDVFTVFKFELFQRCYKLRKIIIPDSVEEIQYSVFKDCSSLSEITFGKNLRTLGTKICEGCTNLTKLTFRCKTIPQSSFKDTPSLITLIIEDSVETISPSSFELCQSLTVIDFKENPLLPLSIQSMAFANCISLNQITLPSRISTIQSNCFAFCSNFERFNSFDSNDFRVENELLYNYDKKKMLICPGAKEIVVISPETQEISEQAFFGNSKLKSVDLGKISTIGVECFGDCISLQNVIVPETIKIINNNAFRRCDSLEYIVYCGLINPDTQTEAETKDPFPSKLKLFVRIDYQNSTFFKHKVIKSTSINQNGCPNKPTATFSFPYFFLGNPYEKILIIIVLGGIFALPLTLTENLRYRSK